MVKKSQSVKKTLFEILKKENKMDAERITFYTKHFRFVFQPAEINLINRTRRFYVGCGNLELYLGTINAETVLKKADDLKADKLRIKFPKQGIIDIYCV